MAEVDIVSGLPVDTTVEVTKKNETRIAGLNVLRAKSDQLQESLASETGQVVLQKIQEQLLNRVNKLMSTDGECIALKRLLVGMGLTIDMGQEAVKRLMRLVERK